MAKLFVSVLKTDTVEHILKILRNTQKTMSKLYHEGQFSDDLSDEFFESYEEADKLYKKCMKIRDREKTLNY